MTPYDISIIIPYYHKYEEFQYSIEYNYEQFQLVTEVIVIIDEKIDNLEPFSFLHNYDINFRFFVNCENHPWRNPAIVINKGITEAISEKIIIISPETILLKDSLINLIDGCDDHSFSTGSIIFMTYKSYEKYNVDYFFNAIPEKNKDFYGPVYYGSICCMKKNFIKINYYTKKYSLSGWGGEDDNVRKKLKSIGLIQNKINDAKFIHLESENEFTERFKDDKPNVLENTTQLYDCFNEIYVPGVDVNTIKSSLANINNLIDYSVPRNICSYYPVVLLAQCFNEEKNVADYLINVSRFVDAIIVLDDGSNDNTWNLLESAKLIIKIKVMRKDFNDCRNRSLLLNIFENVLVKNNIKVDWFLWLDFDERITDNKKFLHQIKRIILAKEFDADVVSLPLFHMWDDKNYNSEYPYSTNGIQYKQRLIRNNVEKMPYKISEKNKLHFSLSPYCGKNAVIQLQIKHLSYVNEESRKNKYYLYTQIYDREKVQKSYDHILNNKPKLMPYNDLLLYKIHLDSDFKQQPDKNSVVRQVNLYDNISSDKEITRKSYGNSINTKPNLKPYNNLMLSTKKNIPEITYMSNTYKTINRKFNLYNNISYDREKNKKS